MGDHTVARGDRGGDCSTTDSFSDHGIDDGTELVRGTYYRLREAEPTEVTPEASLFDRLESAFVWAYLGSVEATAIPAHVERAIDDALALTAEEFADRPNADLRTEVIPAFYRRVAGFHCRYRDDRY